jgi:hypothetical protein
MEFTREIDLTKKPAKSLLKTSSDSDKKEKKKNTVVWDTKNLEENAEYLRLHPPTMRIEEPKTPYDPYEQGDDSYLEKVRQMFNVKPTEDVLKDVSNELMKHFDSKGNKKENDDELVEIEVYENGKLIKKKVSRNHGENIEFLKKRRVAYGNEYTNAKRMIETENEENKNNNKEKRELTEEELKEIELDDQTVRNTIINKFSSMVFRRQKEEELKKLNEKKEKGDEKIINIKEEDKSNEKTHKKKERKKIVFMEQTEEIPNVEFPGEKELKKEEKENNNK